MKVALPKFNFFPTKFVPWEREKMKINNRIGKIGEKLAAEYLEKHGYEIITTNFYTKRGEIDIIARKDNEIVFVEVKTRSSDSFGKPVEAVNYFKQKHLYQTAKYYMYKKCHELDYIRFDVIEVYIKYGKVNINNIKKIF